MVGIIEVDVERCKGCGVCVSVCPRDVLEMSVGVTNAKGYYYPVAGSFDDCSGCANCFEVCADYCVRVERG